MSPRMLIIASLSALLAAAFASPVVYKASFGHVPDGHNNATWSSGTVSISLWNSSYGSGYFYATKINQMTQAFVIFQFQLNSSSALPPPLLYAFNATYGPLSGSVKVSFAFNPSVNNVSTLLGLRTAYFVVTTASNPFGELGGHLKLVSGRPPSPSPFPPGEYEPTQNHADFNKANCVCGLTKNPLTWLSFGNPGIGGNDCLCLGDSCEDGVRNSCGFGLFCSPHSLCEQP